MAIGLLMLSVRQVFRHTYVGTPTILRFDVVSIITTEKRCDRGHTLNHVTTPPFYLHNQKQTK